MWEELIDVLGKICLAYDGLTKLGEKKRDALVAINMTGLSKILDEEQLIAAKIENLEIRRKAILQELSKNNIAISNATKAEDFYKNAPTRAIENRLVSLHKLLTKNVNAAIKIRDNNQVLAQGALDAVKYHLNRLSNAAVQPTYGKSGGIVTHQQKFDYQA